MYSFKIEFEVKNIFQGFIDYIEVRVRPAKRVNQIIKKEEAHEVANYPKTNNLEEKEFGLYCHCVLIIQLFTYFYMKVQSVTTRREHK